MCRFPVVSFVDTLLLAGPSPQESLFMAKKTDIPEPIQKSIHTYDPITDWIPPPFEVVKKARRERIEPLRSLTSPVFFSTDHRTGKRHCGLSRLPPESTRPLLFVSNHQLVGIDSWMVVSELIEERNIFTRALGHPLIFPSSENNSGNGQILARGINRDLSMNRGEEQNADWFLESFGAVKVSPKNLYRLMETNQAALLFPGGARESFHGGDEAYTLKAWPDDKSDFVRIAAKFNATIIPFSSVGAAESVYFLADPPDHNDLPFGIGNAIADFMGENVPFDARYDNGEVLTLPLLLPKPVPARHLYLFHKPMTTSNIDHRNREKCTKMYGEIKTEIKRGIDELLLARKKDPFKDPVRRILYEQVWKKQAPTFPVSELNSAPL